LKREERVWYAGNLIGTPMMDFETLHVLLESMLYPQAVFHFQQAIEEAIKAILIYLDLVLIIITMWLEVGTSCLKKWL